MALTTTRTSSDRDRGWRRRSASRSSFPTRERDDELLREFGMEEHPRGGFHGLLEVIPTKADWLLDLIRANSLWPLLSGLSLLRHRDDEHRHQPRTTSIASACSRSAPARGRRTC